MKEMLLHLPPGVQGNYLKVHKNIYYRQDRMAFYKLAFLPQGILFHDEQVSQAPIAAFTPYDPTFLALNLLNKGPVPLSELPYKLTSEHFETLSDQEIVNGELCCHLNREKAYHFLEKKVSILQDCIEGELGGKTFKLINQSQGEKHLRDETVLVLRSEVESELFFFEFAKERYGYEKSRKVFSSYDEVAPPMKKSNPKKSQSKKKEFRMEAGQQNLTGFFKKN